MVTIEIDEDVYNRLKSLAEPFVDTPNIVLRRILFPEPKATYIKQKINDSASKSFLKDQGLSSVVFMNLFLKNKYKEKFHLRSPFRTMFESQNHLIYFQNFNKAGTVNLWYRLSKGSLDVLRNTEKIALVCFTNPSENTVFEIPLKDIDKKATESNWNKDFFEVNIDPANFRWRELDWNIERYLVNVKAS